MIRRGKKDGWLSANHASLLTWAKFNGIECNDIDIKPVANKGLAVVTSFQGSFIEQPLIRVPKHLVLSKEFVELHCKSDVHLKAVIDALGDFGRTTRGRILSFLLLQATGCNPDATAKISVASPLTEYIKYLPLELLPTFWTEEEIELLAGTSLAPALDAKMKSLHREFSLLRSTTANMPWCQQVWWSEDMDLLSFDDWKQVDGFYRSRALDLPGLGDCMVPCIDMCNHAGGDRTSALYESDENGDALLLPYNQPESPEQVEVSITYGDRKGACEMIFSYGFLDPDMLTARDIFLDLKPSEDDPLGPAKKAIATTAPGVRLSDGASGLAWESDYIWLLCVNEEDGLDFELSQLVDGSRELKCSWKNQELEDTSRLKEILQLEPLWNIFRLRATVTVQSRVAVQLKTLYESNDRIEILSGNTALREGPRDLARKLRALETGLLEDFYEYLENEKLQLSNSEEVQNYLSASRNLEGDDPIEDFS